MAIVVMGIAEPIHATQTLQLVAMITVFSKPPRKAHNTFLHKQHLGVVNVLGGLLKAVITATRSTQGRE